MIRPEVEVEGMEVWKALKEAEPRKSSSKLYEAYRKWDALNPHFYPLFCRFAKQLAERGHRNIGVALIFERIRWESLIRTEGEEWKLNNSYRSIYARRFMAEHPQYEGMFRLRELRAMSEDEVK